MNLFFSTARLSPNAQSKYSNLPQAGFLAKFKLITLALFTGLLLANTTVSAAPAVSAQQMVKTSTSEVLAYLEANKEELAKDEQKVYTLVRESILPHFDFRYMSQLVLAKHWRRASDAQKDRFVNAFKGLLVSTYANSLREYSGQTVEYLPFRAADDAEKVTVKIEVIPAAGLPIPIDYQLKVSDNEWKIYDVNIDGLSIVSNYRSSIGDQVSSTNLDAVIKDIEAKQ